MFGVRCCGTRSVWSQAVISRFKLQDEVDGGFGGRLEIWELSCPQTVQAMLYPGSSDNVSSNLSVRRLL